MCKFVNYLLGGFTFFNSGIGLNKINKLKKAALAWIEK